MTIQQDIINFVADMALVKQFANGAKTATVTTSGGSIPTLAKLAEDVLAKATPGLNGADGNTILSGGNAPANNVGKDGDFYLNTATAMMHGPKAGGIWPSGKPLIGPKGDKGDKGDGNASKAAAEPILVASIGDGGAFIGTASYCDISKAVTALSLQGLSGNRIGATLPFVTRGRFVFTADCGIGASKVATILSRDALAAANTRKSIVDARATGATVAIVSIGIHDILETITNTSTQAQIDSFLNDTFYPGLTAIFRRIQQQGMQVMYRSLGGYGPGSHATTNGYSQAQIDAKVAVIKTASDYIKNTLIPSLGFVTYLDLRTDLVDATTGAWKTGISNDGLYEGPNGAQRVAEVLAPQLAAWAGVNITEPVSRIRGANAFTNPAMSNPSGGVIPGLSLNVSTGLGTNSRNLQAVQDIDGVPTQVFEVTPLTFSTSNVAKDLATVAINFELNMSGATAAFPVEAGDLVSYEYDLVVEAMDGTAPTNIVSLVSTLSLRWNSNANSFQYSANRGDTLTSYLQSPTVKIAGRMISPPMVVPYDSRDLSSAQGILTLYAKDTTPYRIKISNVRAGKVPNRLVGMRDRAMLYGAVDPTATNGVEGDMYLNLGTGTIFGPKSSGVWPAGRTLLTRQGTANSIMFLGDSITSAGTFPAGLPETSPVRPYFPTLSNLNARGLFVLTTWLAKTFPNTAGAALRFYAADNTMTWQAPGDTEGAKVAITDTFNFYTLPSGTAGNELYAQILLRNKPVADAVDSALIAPSSGPILFSNGGAAGFVGNLLQQLGNPFAKVISHAIPSSKLSDWVNARRQWKDTYTDLTHIFLGTNDVLDRATALQALIDIESIIKDRLAVGSRVICGCLMPYNSRTAAAQQAVAEFNLGLRDLGEKYAIKVWDAMPYVQNPDGTWVAEYTKDGLHPSAQGSYVMAKRAIAPLMRPWVRELLPSIPALPAYSATTAPYGNQLVNPTLTGSVAASGTSGVSGNIPTGWTVSRDTGTVITAVCTAPGDAGAPSLPNGRQGKYFKVVLDNTGGTDGERIRIRPTNFITTGVVAGDYVVYEGEFTLSGTGIGTVEVSLNQTATVGSIAARAIPGDGTTNLEALDGDTFTYRWKSKPMLIEAGFTNMVPGITVSLKPNGQATYLQPPTHILRRVPAPV